MINGLNKLIHEVPTLKIGFLKFNCTKGNLSFSDSIETGSPVETEIVRLDSFSTTEIKALKTLVWRLSRESMKETSSLKK